MKTSVHLGLLCLSLLISSLHGGEEEDKSMEYPLMFDEPELHQLEENRKTKRKRPRPGGLTPLGDSADPTIHIYHRTKRQEKSRNNKRKKRPGSQSLLASSGVLPWPQQTAKVKRDVE